MKAIVSLRELNGMLKAATAFADKGGVVEGRIAFIVHDGKFEVMALSCDGPTAELHQWVDAQSGYNDDFECVYPVEEGACTVKIKDIPRLKNTPDDTRALFDTQKDTLTITVGNYAFHMNASNKVYDGYSCAKPKGDSETVLQFSPQDSAAFAFVAPAMAPSEFSRDEFMGIHIRDGRAVATDGHRMHICPMTTPDAALIGTLSAKLANFLAGRLQFPGTLTEYRETQETKVHKGRGKFEIETKTFATWHVYEHKSCGGVHIRLVSRPVVGLYPDFMKAIPDYKIDEIADIDAEVLAKTVKMLSSGLKLSNCIFECTADKNLHITCRAMRLNRKSNEEVIDESIPPRATTIPAENFQSTICFNSRYILEALSGKSGTIQLCVIDQDSPAWFGPWSGSKCDKGAILMPMMI